ncbi:3-oxoacyl-[acyl-carrier-protein] reductase [Anaerocolumna xylanovorans]|uniref:3-oxoacyl-[acyl-carrier-protein] reductase n=1 Tax=Anaerocolumna xylanovorans DSM 12503 TaxID=1121345 RepID=A0A1M7YGY8_9FIRM|nr:3-oxoacyl-[acyl-carrier-protein] reductase [Anaerocolumna xylanovorans]SHO51863.1 3-oxoacyl-[acyl-carrier-protein] reductase [Anaerocolumna xylanovorans DSM 12503]
MLEGKIALVTGGSRGIGKAIALALAENGATVIVNYCGSEEAAKQTVNEIVTKGGTAFLLKGDVSDSAEVDKMFIYIAENFKRLDILINNAGITRDNLILKMSDKEFDQVIDLNLRGVFYCLRQASRMMLKQRYGKIVNISSISGIHGNPGQVNYSAAKAGVIGMTKTLAKELASRNINVNAIAPGYINTDMTANLKEEFKSKVLEAVPLRRFGEGSDIAEAAVFLASDKASYITGQVLSVDGGMGI